MTSVITASLPQFQTSTDVLLPGRQRRRSPDRGGSASPEPQCRGRSSVAFGPQLAHQLASLLVGPDRAGGAWHGAPGSSWPQFAGRDEPASGCGWAGTSRAMIAPRSVMSISSPRLTRANTPAVFWLSSRTGTICADPQQPGLRRSAASAVQQGAGPGPTHRQVRPRALTANTGRQRSCTWPSMTAQQRVVRTASSIRRSWVTNSNVPA